MFLPMMSVWTPTAVTVKINELDILGLEYNSNNPYHLTTIKDKTVISNLYSLHRTIRAKSALGRCFLGVEDDLFNRQQELIAASPGSKFDWLAPDNVMKISRNPHRNAMTSTMSIYNIDRDQ